MFQYLSRFSSLLLLALFWTDIYSFVHNGNEIRDLQELDLQAFTQEAKAWNLSENTIKDHIFYCHGVPLLGASSSVDVSLWNYTRNYSGLFTSYQGLIITFDTYILQRPETLFSTNPFSSFITPPAILSSKAISGILSDPGFNDTTIFSSIEEKGGVCGFSDEYRLVISKFHLQIRRSPLVQLLLYLRFTNIPNVRYIGIRNVRILASMVTPTTLVYFCKLFKPDNLPFRDKCNCPEGSILLDTTQVCLSCHPSCGSCYGSEPWQCFYCKSNYFFNGTHCIPCHSSCKTCIGPLENQCLSCDHNYILNGTVCDKCHPTCKTCSGTSLNQCLTCESTSTVFPNGTSIPKRYLYEDSTCLDICDFPFAQQEGNNTLLCKTRCGIGLYYDIDSNTCTSSCVDPYVINQRDGSCSLRISSEELQQLQTLGSLKDTSGTVVSAGTSLMSAGFPGDSGAISVGMLTKMLKYIRYLNISHSAKLELIFKKEKSSTSPLGTVLELDKQLQDKVNYASVPPIFAKYKVHSDFFINYWDNIPVLATTFLFSIFAKVLRLVLRSFKKKSLTSIIRKLEVTIQNLFLTFFYASYGDIVMFSGLELREIVLELPLSIFSFVFCILLLIASLATIIIHFRILLTHQALIRQAYNNPDNEKLKEFQDKNEGFKVFFFTFKEQSFFHQAFLLFFIIRVIVFHLVLVILYEHPLLQINIILTINIAILVYLVLKRPMKRLVDLLQQVSIESLILGINVCLFILAIIDASESPNPGLVDSVSEVIIMINVVFNYLPLAFIGAKLFIALKEFIDSKKAKKQQLKDLKSNIHTVRLDSKHNLSLKNFTADDTKTAVINDQSTEQMFDNSTIIQKEMRNSEIFLATETQTTAMVAENISTHQVFNLHTMSNSSFTSQDPFPSQNQSVLDYFNSKRQFPRHKVLRIRENSVFDK